MRAIVAFSVLTLLFSSCIVEIEFDPPNVTVGTIEEYETEEVIREVWSRGVLIYEEIDYTAWIEMEFINNGGLRADNVWAEVIFYDGNRKIQTISFDIPDLRSGNAYTYTLDTGFDSTFDYTDYEINVYWD